MSDITISQLDEMQCASVTRSLDHKRRIAATSGPAGSGKTTLMRFVTAQLLDSGYRPVIAAPTGKAARRVRQATGYPAFTVHSLLEFTRPGEIDEKTGKPVQDSYPKRYRMKPLEYDNVLVDEYAMVPTELHRQIIDALPRGGRLCAFGDVQQLKPIEQNARLAAMPTPFEDLLQRFDGVQLTNVHRQAGDSGVLYNAQRILRGVAPVKRSDFVLHITEKPVDMLRMLLDTVDYRRLDNQIITPGNNSWIGAYKLNVMLQATFMHTMPRFDLPRHKWDSKHPLSVGIGDKIVMTRNNYEVPCSNGETGVFNGEVGVVLDIDHDDTVHVDLEDRVAFIPPAMEISLGSRTMVVYPQRDIALAYALTTHKCQGSEYQHVTYMINRSVMGMLNRRNFYTAVTRARQHVNVVADMRGLSLSLSRKEQMTW